jgi:ribosome-binding factor A
MEIPRLLHVTICLLLLSAHAHTACSFAVVPTAKSTKKSTTTTTRLYIMRSSRSSNTRGGPERTKRQERIGHVVRTELSGILNSGVIKGRDVEYLDDELRRRISIVATDVSPDLRQARISVSVSSLKKAGADGTVDKRRAYSWLVRNTKQLRHTLAQRLKHMKSVPNLTFVQVNIAQATDVMYLIDSVSAGAKREAVDIFGGVNPKDMVFAGDDEDEDDEEWTEEDDEEWTEEDDDFFK